MIRAVRRTPAPSLRLDALKMLRRASHQAVALLAALIVLAPMAAHADSAGRSALGLAAVAKNSAPVTLQINSGTTVAALNAWLAAPLGSNRQLIGTMNVDAPIILQPNTVYDFRQATFVAKAGWAEDNLFRNRAVAAVQTVSGVSMTAGSNAVTSSGAFTPAMDGQTVSVSNTGISAYSGTAPTYGLFHYVDASNGTILPVVAALTTHTGVAAVASASGQTMSIFQRDSNITILGGVIDRRNAPTSGPDGNIKHVVLFRRIDGLKIEGVTVYTASAKYAWSLGDVSHVRIKDLSFPVANSDGLHFIGPGYDIRAENIRGSTQDSLVAFTAADYSIYSDTSGDFLNIRVKDITAENAATALGAITGTNLAARDFEVDGIHGTTNHPTVALLDDFTGPTDMSVVLRNITGYSTDLTMPQVNVTATQIKTLRIEGIEFRPQSSTGFGNNGRIAVLGAVNSLVVRNARVPEPPTSATNWTAISVYATGTVGRVQVDGWDFTGSVSGNGGLPIYAHTAISDVEFSNSDFTNVVNLMAGDATSVSLRINTSNLKVINVGDVFDLRCTTTWLYDAVYADAFGSYFRSRGATARTHTIIGSGLYGTRNPTSSMISLSGSTLSPTIHIVDRTFPVDLSILAKANGDAANNTNASLSAGLGSAISDGTNWKNTFTGASY